MTTILRNVAASLLLAGVVWWRGEYLARITGGVYRAESLMQDVALLLGFVLVLRLLDWILKWVASRLVPGEVRSRRIARSTLHAAAAIGLAAPLILAALQLHPQKVGCVLTPAALGLRFEEVELISGGRRLSAWYLPGSQEADQVVIAHGLGANKANFLPAARTVHRAGYGCLMFDFRGHGDSEGRTVTFGYREAEDVAVAHDWLARRHPGRPIHALGYSMGGAAVLRAARHYDIFDRVIVDSSFATAEGAARGSILRPLGPLAAPIWRLGCAWGRLLSGVDLRDHRPGDDAARLGDKPLLIIHGTRDRMIPLVEGERLHRAAPGSQWWPVAGADHVTTLMHPDYGSRIASFLRGD